MFVYIYIYLSKSTFVVGLYQIQKEELGGVWNRGRLREMTDLAGTRSIMLKLIELVYSFY